MERGRKTKTQRQKNLLTMTSGGCVIVVRNNSMNRYQYIAFFRAYLATFLKAHLKATLSCAQPKKKDARKDQRLHKLALSI